MVLSNVIQILMVCKLHDSVYIAIQLHLLINISNLGQNSMNFYSLTEIIQQSFGCYLQRVCEISILECDVVTNTLNEASGFNP